MLSQVGYAVRIIYEVSTRQPYRNIYSVLK